MSDSYHTIGAQKDRARTWSYLERIAEALERIADTMEKRPEPIFRVEDLQIGDLTDEEAERFWEALNEDEIANWCAGCGVEGHSDEDPHPEVGLPEDGLIALLDRVQAQLGTDGHLELANEVSDRARQLAKGR